MGNRKDIGKLTDCIFCEGTAVHWGKPCGACDGSGSEMVRKQMVKVFRAKNGLKITPQLLSEEEFLKVVS